MFLSHPFPSVLLAVALQLCSANYIITADSQESSDITCWTCPSKKNNDECNDWAPDVKCPLNNTVCKTVHTLNKVTGDSISVIKQCALPSECDPSMVGCTAVPNTDHTICVSCCDYSYCNVAVPVNVTTAVRLSSFLSGATGLYPTMHLTTYALVFAFSRIINGLG